MQAFNNLNTYRANYDGANTTQKEGNTHAKKQMDVHIIHIIQVHTQRRSAHSYAARASCRSASQAQLCVYSLHELLATQADPLAVLTKERHIQHNIKGEKQT